MTEARVQRLFVALWPDDAVRSALCEVQTRLDLARLGRPTPAKNLHMTLLFLGDIPKEDALVIKSLIEQFELAPFSLAINRIGYWPHNNIVWAGLDHLSIELADLSKQIQRVLKTYVAKRRKFTPHVTLARKVPKRVHTQIEPISWQVQALCLVHSTLTNTGAQYKLITHSKDFSQKI